MSCITNQRPTDQLLCAICLDVFTDPVTTPCGHNFCKNCINQFWDNYARYLCPVCKEMFNPKPELLVNTLISDLAEEFRKSARNKVQKQNAPNPEECPNDAATGAMRKSKMCWLLIACLIVIVAAAMKQNYPLRTTEGQAEGLLEKRRNELELLPGVHAEEVQLMEAQRYRKYITFDKDTAHRRLIVSDDGKLVRSGSPRELKDSLKRFSLRFAILGQPGFSSGQFYFEVLVKGKTDWTLGVAEESIDRKGNEPLMPQSGYWTIRLKNRNEYKALAGPVVVLSLQARPDKVGVFVDYEAGLVSFYDADSAALIYSFTSCSFTEKLYPYFGPASKKGGENVAPLVIVSA